MNTFQSIRNKIKEKVVIKNFKRTIQNFLLIIFFFQFKYGVSYIKGISGHFNLGMSLINNEWSELRNYYWSDSPLFHILQKIFQIRNYETYIIFIYITTLFFLLLISIKISELENLSIFFILSGWLISVSWVVGLVDALIVWLILYNSIDVIKNEKLDIRNFLINIFLTFNHFAISIFINFTIFIIWNDKKSKKLIFLSTSYLFGFLINMLYKSLIQFNGETRVHYLLRPTVIPTLFENNPEVLKYIIFSGFYGFLPVIIFFLYKNFFKNMSKIFIPLVIAILGSFLAADSSRIFSYLAIPTILITIYKIKDDLDSRLLNILSIASIFFVIFFEEYWVIDHIYIFSGSEYGADSRILYEVIIEKFRAIIN